MPSEDWQEPDPPLPPKTAREIRREVAQQALHPFNDTIDTPHSDLRDREEVRRGPETPRETAERHQVEDAEGELLDNLKALRELQGGEGVIYKVFRIGYPNGEPLRHAPQGEVCGEIGASQLDATIIGNLFGGGKYRVRGRYSNGQFAGERTVVIAGDFRSSATMNPVPVGGAPAFNFQEFMAQQEIRDAQRRREAEEERERNRRERNEMIALLGPIVAPIIAAMVGNKGPDVATLVGALKPPPPPDPIAQLVALRELDQRPKEVDPIDRAFKVMELMQDRMPSAGGEESTSWVKELIRALAPALPEIVKNLPKPAPAQPVVLTPNASAAPVAPPAMPAAPVVAPVSPIRLAAPSAGVLSASPANGTPESEEAMNLQLLALLPWFKGQVDILLKRAARQADPALAADAFMMDFPEDVDPHVLLPLLEESQWWPLLQRFDARVSEHQEWFSSFHRSLVEIVRELQQEAASAPAAVTAPATAPPIVPSRAPVTAAAAEPFERPTGPPNLFGEPT